MRWSTWLVSRYAVLDPFIRTNIPENTGAFHPTGVWFKRTEVLVGPRTAGHAVILRYWYLAITELKPDICGCVLPFSRDT